MHPRLTNAKRPHDRGFFLELGYLDSNPEQLMRAGLPVRQLSSPKFRVISRKLMPVVYLFLRANTDCSWHFSSVYGTQNGTITSGRLTGIDWAPDLRAGLEPRTDGLHPALFREPFSHIIQNPAETPAPPRPSRADPEYVERKESR
jgi:hypothetical protein